MTRIISWALLIIHINLTFEIFIHRKDSLSINIGSHFVAHRKHFTSQRPTKHFITKDLEEFPKSVNIVIHLAVKAERVLQDHDFFNVKKSKAGLIDFLKRQHSR